MSTKMTELPENDKKYMYKVLLGLGLSQLGLSRLLACSNVVNHWTKGYRRVPRSFRRFILVLQFVNKKGLMHELNLFIKEQEKEERANRW